MTASQVEEFIAELQTKQQRELEAARRRFTLFVLESVAGDGLPRASRHSVDTLHGQGLIEPVGDNEQHWRLTAEGRNRFSLIRYREMFIRLPRAF